MIADFGAARERIVTENPLCKPCLDGNQFTIAEAVDYVRCPETEGGTITADNLEPVCLACLRSRLRPPVQGVDLHGYPVDPRTRWHV